MYVYQRRHVHVVETRRRLTKFEVRTQVPPLIHWCVCGEKGDAYIYMYGIMVLYIHTTTKQQQQQRVYVGIHTYIHTHTYIYRALTT